MPKSLNITRLDYYLFLSFKISNCVEHGQKSNILHYFDNQVQEFGVTEVRDLKPNGRNIAVTEETKMEYIRLVCQMKMTGAIRKQ